MLSLSSQLLNRTDIAPVQVDDVTISYRCTSSGRYLVIRTANPNFHFDTSNFVLWDVIVDLDDRITSLTIECGIYSAQFKLPSALTHLTICNSAVQLTKANTNRITVEQCRLVVPGKRCHLTLDDCTLYIDLAETIFSALAKFASVRVTKLSYMSDISDNWGDERDYMSRYIHPRMCELCPELK